MMKMLLFVALVTVEMWTAHVNADCEAWTIQNNLAGVGDKASTAATLEDCRAECIDNDECTGVDWVAAQTTGRQCWVVGPWTRKSKARSGIDRHTLDRTCLTEVDAQSTVDDSASCENSTLDEAVNLIRDVKNLLGPNQQQNDESSISRKDFEDLKAACASNQQQNFEDLKAACASNQQQNNASCISFEDLKAACASNQQQCPSPPTAPSSSNQALISSFISSCVPVLIQQNVNGSKFFNRSWAEFKVGFSDTVGNYWLGNDLLSQLTLSRHYKLRLDVQLRNLSWYYAEYSSFTVYGESRNYELRVSGYSGNAGDSLSFSNGMMFTTYDRDNDPYTGSRYNDNCAVLWGGGFWYKTCAFCRINCGRTRGDFLVYSPQTGHLQLESSRMWLMC